MIHHRFDALSFLFGALFILAGLLFLSGGTGALPMEWAGPLVALVLGAVIVFAARPRPTRNEITPPGVEES